MKKYNITAFPTTVVVKKRKVVKKYVGGQSKENVDKIVKEVEEK